MDIREMNSKEFDKYDKRCYVIQNLILKDYKNENFDFIRNPETLYVEIIINNNNSITMLPDSSWKEIKRHIEKILYSKKTITEDCIICCETKQTNVSCNKCSNDICAVCYINLFINGKGVYTCPHCRYSIGNMIPEYKIQLSVNEIKRKLGEY